MKKVLCSFLYLMFCLPILGQNTSKEKVTQRFTATIAAGMNASQIDGDAYAGYHKIGLNIGARAGVQFTPKWEAAFEILFSQQGSQSPFIKDQPREFLLDLIYIEVPLLIYFKDWRVKSEDGKKDFYRFHFGIGASYNRLMYGKEQTLNGVLEGDQLYQVANPYLRNHVMLLADINFFFTKNWGINLRYERAPMNIRESKLFNPHMIVFRGLFRF